MEKQAEDLSEPARKRKVLVYRKNLLPLSETFIKEQITALSRWRGVLVGARRLDQLPLDGLDVLILWGKRLAFFEQLRWKTKIWMGKAPRRAIKCLKQENASLIHAHFGFDALEAWPLAKILNVPLAVTLHGNDINIDRKWWEAGHGGLTMIKYPARLLKLAQQPRVRFVAVSDAIRRRAISYGIPEEKIFVCYIGVDTSKFSFSGHPIANRERRVLFVGRLIEKKGCEYLIRAFAQVQKKVRDASLTIVGDGDLRIKLEQLASDLGVPARFRGAVSNAEVMRELELARVFCLPSVRAANGDAEGLPVVLLEAQASGVPVVTSAMGGATEGIQEGVTGFSFAERDVGSLANRLVRLLSDDAAATSMSAAGPRFISDKFDIRQCAEKLESVYDSLASL